MKDIIIYACMTGLFVSLAITIAYRLEFFKKFDKDKVIMLNDTIITLSWLLYLVIAKHDNTFIYYLFLVLGVYAIIAQIRFGKLKRTREIYSALCRRYNQALIDARRVIWEDQFTFKTREDAEEFVREMGLKDDVNTHLYDSNNMKYPSYAPRHVLSPFHWFVPVSKIFDQADLDKLERFERLLNRLNSRSV